MSDFAVGDRVVVRIPEARKELYARDAADALEGSRGAISEFSTRSYALGAYLVEFDEPARTWWANQSPPTAFWFEREDLVLEADR